MISAGRRNEALRVDNIAKLLELLRKPYDKREIERRSGRVIALSRPPLEADRRWEWRPASRPKANYAFLRLSLGFSAPASCPIRYPSAAPKMAETTMTNSGFELSAAVSAPNLPVDKV
jgi:hypothetical protein